MFAPGAPTHAETRFPHSAAATANRQGLVRADRLGYVSSSRCRRSISANRSDQTPAAGTVSPAAQRRAVQSLTSSSRADRERGVQLPRAAE